MKNKILLPLLAIVLFVFNNTNAQLSQYAASNNEIQVWDKIEMNGKFRPSLRLLDFLRKDGRFGPRFATKQLLKRQVVSNTYNANSNSPNYWLYFNNDLILGDAVNRLDLIDQIRLKQVKAIAKKVNGAQQIIFVTTMDFDSKITFVKK